MADPALASSTFDRRRLVKLSAGLAMTSVVGLRVATEADAGTRASYLPGDLGMVKVLATGALVGAGYYQRGAASKRLDTRTKSFFSAALQDQRANHAALANILTTAGLPAPTSEDTIVGFPAKIFRSRASIIAFGVIVERLIVGAHLGAIATSAAIDLTAASGQVAASSAAHLGYLSRLSGAKTVAPPKIILAEDAADAFGNWTS